MPSFKEAQQQRNILKDRAEVYTCLSDYLETRFMAIGSKPPVLAISHADSGVRVGESAIAQVVSELYAKRQEIMAGIEQLDASEVTTEGETP